MSVSNLSWLKKKSQSVDITAPGFSPLAAAGKPTPQASKAPTPKTPIIEEEQNNTTNTQKHPSRRSELKRFYTIDWRNFDMTNISLLQPSLDFSMVLDISTMMKSAEGAPGNVHQWSNVITGM